MSERNRAAERAAAVADAMDDIAEIDAHGREHGGIDRAGAERIRERLLLLAERGELFGDDDFPSPDSSQSSVSYRIAQNDDDELALYVQCVADGTSAPPHEHTTWAVIVGLRGQELEPPVRPLRRRRRAAGAARGGGRAGQRGWRCSATMCTRSTSRPRPTSTATAWPSKGSADAGSGTPEAASGAPTTTSAT